MHTDEFTLMNIHEGEYFRIMVVKILMSSLLGCLLCWAREPMDYSSGNIRLKQNLVVQHT